MQVTDDDVGAREELPLSKAAEYLLQECRTVLPGIQALFGFQLIAVFNSGFGQTLSVGEQRLHLAALFVVAIAAVFIMTPAAYHRQTGAREVTERFIRVSTRLLLWSMWPLALGVCIDFYLIARIILDNVLAPLAVALLLAVFVCLWLILPRARSWQRALGKPRRRSFRS